jgi:hypothetical protein
MAKSIPVLFAASALAFPVLGCSGSGGASSTPRGDASAIDADASASGDDVSLGSAPDGMSMLNLGSDDGPSEGTPPAFVDPYSGESGCHVDAGAAGCGLMMPLSGGIATTLYAAAGQAGCGSGSAGFGGTVYSGGYATDVLFQPGTPLTPGQTGRVAVSVRILRDALDGGAAGSGSPRSARAPSIS